MKSFDRRSFGKLLLGAAPAVFLAKTASARTWQTVDGGTFTEAELTKNEQKITRWQDLAAEDIPAHCGNTTKRTYSCGHFSLYRYTAGDPAGLLGLQVLPKDPHSPVVYEVSVSHPCPDCRKKQIEAGVVDIHPYDLFELTNDSSHKGIIDIIKHRAADGDVSPRLTIQGVMYRLTTCVAPKTKYGIAAITDDSKWRMVL